MARGNVLMETDIKCHEVNFEWEIKNALEISKRIHGEIISLDPTCKSKFKPALKVAKIASSIVKLSVGFQRADRSNEILSVIASLKLCDSNNYIFTRRAAKFESDKKCKFHWCISEKFSKSDHKLDCSKVLNVSDSESHTSTTKGLTSSDDSEIDNAKHIVGESLIVKGYLKVYGCCINSSVKSKTKPNDLKEKNLENAFQEVMTDLKLAYESNLYTDVCLKVSDFYIRAHKFVLSARCPYFSKYLCENEKADVLEIHDMDKTVLESFLRFLYTGIVGSVKWKTLRELYSVADKYEVLSLKKNCSFSMKNSLKYSNACDVLQLADKYHDEDLKMYATNFITNNFENNTVAYNFSEIVRNNPQLASNVLKLKSLRNM